MFTLETQNGPATPPFPPSNVNVLLVGSQASDAADIKQELGGTTGPACTTSYCADPDEAVDIIRGGDTPVDIIFLDVSLFNSCYPKECFLQFKQSIPDIPIIVLTDRKDLDLQHFVMEEGAADNISQWQLRNDRGRLRNVVDSCCSRHTIARRERDRSDLALKTAEDNYAANLQDAHDVNARLRWENKNKIDDVALRGREGYAIQVRTERCGNAGAHNVLSSGSGESSANENTFAE